MDNPIEFFRKHAVISGTGNVEITVSDKHILTTLCVNYWKTLK